MYLSLCLMLCVFECWLRKPFVLSINHIVRVYKSSYFQGIISYTVSDSLLLSPLNCIISLKTKCEASFVKISNNRLLEYLFDENLPFTDCYLLFLKFFYFDSLRYVKFKVFCVIT